jgi:Domain of unknown function (DUF4134)
MNKQTKQAAMLLLVGLIANGLVAQNGKQAISSATAELKTYVDVIGSLVLAIGGVVGFIGGIRVYIKWNNGDQDVNKALMGWMGSCIFLVLVGTVIKAFFGV